MSRLSSFYLGGSAAGQVRSGFEVRLNPDLDSNWPHGVIPDTRLPPGVVYIKPAGGFTDRQIQEEWEIYHADKHHRRPDA